MPVVAIAEQRMHVHVIGHMTNARIYIASIVTYIIACIALGIAMIVLVVDILTGDVLLIGRFGVQKLVVVIMQMDVQIVIKQLINVQLII